MSWERIVVPEIGKPLPERVSLSHRPRSGGPATSLWLGVGRLNRDTALLNPTAKPGDRVSVELDLQVFPNLLVMCTAQERSGEPLMATVAQLLAVQWSALGGETRVVDPTAALGRDLWGTPHFEALATEASEVTALLTEARTELDRRVALHAAADHTSNAPSARPWMLHVNTLQAPVWDPLAVDCLSAIQQRGGQVGMHVVAYVPESDEQSRGLYARPMLRGSKKFTAALLLGDTRYFDVADGGFSSDPRRDPEIPGRAAFRAWFDIPIEIQVAEAQPPRLAGWTESDVCLGIAAGIGPAEAHLFDPRDPAVRASWELLAALRRSVK